MLDLDYRKIALLMARLKMNYRDLSKVSGISEGNLRNIIIHHQRPRLDTVGRLAGALQADVLEIVKEV